MGAGFSPFMTHLDFINYARASFSLPIIAQSIRKINLQHLNVNKEENNRNIRHVLQTIEEYKTRRLNVRNFQTNQILSNFSSHYHGRSLQNTHTEL